MPSTGQILRFCKPKRYCKPQPIACEACSIPAARHRLVSTAKTRQRDGNDMRQVYDIVKTHQLSLCTEKAGTTVTRKINGGYWIISWALFNAAWIFGQILSAPNIRSNLALRSVACTSGLTPESTTSIFSRCERSQSVVRL